MSGISEEESGVERPFVATFVGELFVEAASEEEARQRAISWGERNLTEDTTSPEDIPLRFLAGSDSSLDRFVVPIAGTMNLMGTSQEAVDEKTIRHIELARHTGPYLHVAMGDFRVYSGVPGKEEEGAGGRATYLQQSP